MTIVSVVVPCYNPGQSLFETIASVRAQTWRKIELVLVNDGTSRLECLPIVEQASRLVDRYIGQENRGLSGARNAGFRATDAEFVVPLDAGDLIHPKYVQECMQALEAHPSAAFAYTGTEFFGGGKRVDFGTEYNLYLLLESNHLTCTALVRKADWRCVCGYDESMRRGCEDWEFWLRLGAHGRYGTLVPKLLFRRRNSRPSLRSAAQRFYGDALQDIRRKHPELYGYEALMRIKAEWQPAVCVCGPHEAQTIADIQTVPGGTAPVQSKAAAFLLTGPGGAGPQAAEMSALAVWGGQTALQLSDGSRALSPKASRLTWSTKELARTVTARRNSHRASRGLALGRLRQNLINAELNSWDAWLWHPVRSLLRLVPLRVKERINETVGRPVFDLSFYLQFQPSSVLVGNSVVQPLRYMPRPAIRRRIALITPHLGPGGAEQVLLHIAATLERENFELLVLATQSLDDRWVGRWRTAADHVYDLAALVPPSRMSAAVYSIVTNWRCEAVLVQNCLFGYAALPLIRRDAAETRILDLVHAAGRDWDQIAATAAVSGAIDVRIAVSDDVRRRFLRAGVPEARVRLVRNGVDLQRFRPQPRPRAVGTGRVLFGGRLDAVKRPLLLVDIAERLAALRAARDFKIVIAGDGPELAALKAKARRSRIENVFEFLGLVDDMALLLAQSDMLILPSRDEGVPLVILEAMASGRPVVASKVGAISEAVDPACAILVETGDGEVLRFAAALHQLLNEHHLRQAMGDAGRRKAEAEFDLASSRAAYRRLFG